MPRAIYTNNASTILSVSVNSVATELTVADGSALPTPTGGDYFYLTLAAPGSIEVVKVTARSGNILTVVRAQDNTTAMSFSSGTTAALRVVAALFNELHTDVSLTQSTLQTDINTRATITQLNTVESTLTGSIASISTALTAETTARTTAVSGLQTDINTRATITQLNTVESTLTGSIGTVSTALTAETNARTTAISGLQTQVDARATITQLNTVESNLTGSIATVSTNLTAETNNRIAAVSTVSSAVSTVDGKLTASHGFTVDAGGRVASMKALSNGALSEFAFTADSFKIFNGTSNQAVFTVSGGNVLINGGLIVSGSVVRGVFAGGEIAALSAEGVAANYYEQGTDPGAVANGSTWFKTGTNEYFVRRSGGWGKVADITPAAAASPPGAQITTAAVYQGLDGSNRTTNAAALTLSNLTGTITYKWSVISAGDDDIVITASTSATCAFRWTSMAGDREVTIQCLVTANEGSFVAGGIARWTSLS